jgi:hypothetical protein
MLSVKPNFYQKPQEVFPLCETSFCQCIPTKWTHTYASVCTAHDKGIALSHQSLLPQITMSIQKRVPFNLPPFQLGPKYLPKQTSKNESKSLSLILPNVI